MIEKTFLPKQTNGMSQGGLIRLVHILLTLIAHPLPNVVTASLECLGKVLVAYGQKMHLLLVTESLCVSSHGRVHGSV